MHCIQYALVGHRMQFVGNTLDMTDDQIRERALLYTGDRHAKIERINRCPTCEVWTISNGRLRTNIDCPAVIEARDKANVEAATENGG